MDMQLFINILGIIGDKSAIFSFVFLSLLIYDKPASVKHNKLLRKSFPVLILGLNIHNKNPIENPDNEINRWD